MKILFIHNPLSGVRTDRSDLPAVLTRFIAAHGLECQVASTGRPGHATELAARGVADGCELVVAVGGDGTLNEVASALVGTGTVLGIVPCGSGNGLARHLRVPLRVDAALDLLVSGRTCTIDSGTVDGRPFFVAAGLGFEARVAHAFARSRRRGFVEYLRLSATAFWSHRVERCEVVVDGAAHSLTFFTLAVANGGQYGNNAHIAPRAEIDDGALDLVAVPRVTWRNALTLLYRLRAGTLDRMPDVTMLRGSRFVIRRAAPGLIHIDGEPFEAGAEIEVVVRPRSLRVRVPPQAPVSASA